MLDTIVIGGGPAGSRVAARLAERGVQVLVLERKHHLGEKLCCTGIVGKECVDAFGIGPDVILRTVNSASLFSPSGERLYLRREEMQACVLDRAAFDVSMAERAQRAGAEYSYDTLAIGLSIEPGHASIKIAQNGKDSTLSAKSVIIAAGFAPGLLRRVGLGNFRDYTYGAQAEVQTNGSEEIEVFFGEIAPGFFAWIVPTTPGMARAGLLSRSKPGQYLSKWLQHLKSQGKIASSDVKMHYGGIPLKPLPRTYAERMLVVGDAAGQVKPTSGGGIYYGLLCADIAANTLLEALAEDDLSARRVSAYQRTWRRKLGRELTTGYWARKIYERLSNRQIDRIFRAIKAGGIDEALLKAEDLSFDWHGRTLRRLLKYQVITRSLNVVKSPFTREE
jgi:digeranylgeranylglycerophospholipid reductase